MPKIKLTLPSWYDERSMTSHPACDEVCEFVDTLIANVQPDPNLIDIYYGEDAPPAAYRAFMFDRMVLLRESGSYVVMPNTPSNKRLWELVEA